jgi:hypothetical protein
MKSIRNIMLAVLCGISCSVVDVNVGLGAALAQPIQPFTFMGWVKNTNGMRKDLLLNKAAPLTGLILALGAGGLVGTGFITKKMVRMCKEAIALKKQIQENPKDRSLRKKRRALIGKAVGMGIGGLVLFLVSGLSLFVSMTVAKAIRVEYAQDKLSWACKIDAEKRSDLMRKLKGGDARDYSYVPLSSAQLENYELLMAGKPLPLRKPRDGDTLDAVCLSSSSYFYDSETKTWEGLGGELKDLRSYNGKTWADFGFTDPATW